MTIPDISRREFLKAAAVSSGVMALGARASASVLGANDRIHFGLIGLGNQGSNHLQNIPPIPKIVCRNFTKNFAAALLSNGLIGIRPGSNPLAQAQTVVGGFVRSHPLVRTEAIAPAPYPLGTDIKVNGVSLRQNSKFLTIDSQTLDMSTGELWTEMTFSPGPGLRLAIGVLQFASRSVPALLCQEIQLTPSSDASVEILTKIDRAGLPGFVYLSQAPYDRKDIDQVMGFRYDRNKLGIALAVVPGEGITRKAVGSYAFDGRAGRTYLFCTLAATVSEVYHPDPELQAIRLARWGEMLGFDRLRRQNRAAWSNLWKARVKVFGSPADQRALDAAFFYLHSSAHPSCLTGTPPYGLSRFDAGDGQIFWDMDTWMFPAVLLASPPAARAMLEFRLRGLESARKKAALFGCRGVQFPWQAAALDGSEATPAFGATGWAEQHIVPDVALAFWEYQVASQDRAFLRDGTWPVLRAVAEWIASRGKFTPRGFEIHNVMGPDESVGNINNNSYMNLACKLVMTAALECAHEMGFDPPAAWERIAGSIVIPIDTKRGIVLPYDNARPGPRYSVGMMQYLFIHDPPVSLKLLKSTYQFEESLRTMLPKTGSNPCSPAAPGFSCPPIAAMAAFFDDRQKAAELFKNSWEPYWADPYGIPKEYQGYSDGAFITDSGSLLMTAMLGFTGLRITDGDWRKYPATLPIGWIKIEIDRIWVKGVPKRLVAVQGKLPTLLNEPR